MATAIIPGQTDWRVTRDDDGHREYKIKFRVRSAITDGPANVLNTPGLPAPGSAWAFDGDSDPWAFCKLNATATPAVTEEPNTRWEVELTFSTKSDPKRCKDQQIDDPLLEPQKISGGFSAYQEEATVDRFGQPILSSSHEQMRGSQVEFDATRYTVRVEQNVSTLNLALCTAMRDHVNNDVLWGNPARCVKLKNFTWDKKYYGACYIYYTRIFEFEIREDGFDRDLLDEGTKVLNGHWDPSTGAWILDNIGGLKTPGKPSLSSVAGGTLTVGATYGYRIVARNAAGTTLAGPEATIVLGAGSGSVKIAWTAISGAASYDIYGRTAGGELLLANQTVNNYTDTGAATPAGALPGTDTSGAVAPDFRNPAHFVHFKDRNGENCRVILDGVGLPAEVNVGSGSAHPAGSIHVEKYDEANFLLLGIPTTL